MLHALGMLCGLGAATFATAAVGRWYGVALVPLGFAVAAFWLRPDPVWIGGLVALVAALQLVWPDRAALTAVSAGVLAGLWGVVLQGAGLPVLPALMLAASVPAVSMVLARRRKAFAPAALREEACLGVGLLGLTVAMGPAMTAGWGSAAALNLEPGSGHVMEAWVLFVGGGSVAFGGIYTLWRRG